MSPLSVEKKEIAANNKKPLKTRSHALRGNAVSDVLCHANTIRNTL